VVDVEGSGISTQRVAVDVEAVGVGRKGEVEEVGEEAYV
jgi:hypothetical protein